MWILIISSCVSVCLVMTLIFCICWRKKSTKEDWHGPDGMVTQKNPDENVNHLPSSTTVVDGIPNDDAPVLNKRNIINNSRRSLPDIPAEQATISWDPTDNSSEHYATLGQYQHAAKRHTIANGVEQRTGASQHKSSNQNDEIFSPYERVKYPKSKEHAYAQLHPNSSRPILEEAVGTSEERVNLLRSDLSMVDEPADPERSRRSSLHSNGGLDIPAASAVAGVVAASPELPYMTPPVTQANFSGDSQDSSKGYTSISVREPLANILAQTNDIKKSKRDFTDPHYSTVSDDSDDVYTTIPDPNNPIYTSESETYARIPPLPITVEVEVNPPPPAHLQIQQPIGTGDEFYESPPPQPPPVDSLKQAKAQAQNQPKTFSHSRQASSSSSIANLGSPKPEKRQANSPLPPPPTVTNFDFHTDKLQGAKNLDDLYAKVHKTKKDDPNIEKVEKRSISPEMTNNLGVRSSLESKMHERKYKEHNYETLKSSPRRTSDPGYEKIRGNEEPGYASINGPESIPSSDPGYEVLKNRTPSESDPNYEELRHRVSNASESSGYTKIRDLQDGYSIVNKTKKFTNSDVLDEPNYESMKSEDSNYAGSKSNSSESDPNYESVNHGDPNYESVKDLEDPPYERLDEDSSRTNSDLSGCDKTKRMELEKNDTSGSSSSIGKSSSDKTDPPYEQLNNDTDSEVPGYEKIGNKLTSARISMKNQNSAEQSNSINILDEDGIVQV